MTDGAPLTILAGIAIASIVGNVATLSAALYWRERCARLLRWPVK